MGQLYIAEKPSLGRGIAEALASIKGTAVKSGRGGRPAYLIVGDDVVSWLFGHAFEQARPEDYNPDLKTWKDSSLPIFPDAWRLKVKTESAAQVDIIRDLLKACDVVVHAGDPDREGQLLVDELLEELRCRKPVRRVLLNAMNETAVKKALSDLKDNKDFANLLAAAKGRQRADWLIGMNGSRAFTLAVRRGGADALVSVGRVQTPTVGMVVRRQHEIENFKPVTFFSILAQIEHANGTFHGQWKARTGQVDVDKEGRLLNEDVAKAIVAKVSGQLGRIAKYEVKEEKEPPPLPWSLSKLQAAANQRHGFTAQQTLDICQALYETHKIASYPRTDTGYLPESEFSNANSVFSAIARYSSDFADLARGADAKLHSRAWNDKEAPVHHGIIPLDNANYGGLNDAERKVFEMICQAYLAQFYPPYVYLKTNVNADVAGEVFAATGRVPTNLGWKKVFGATDEPREDDEATQTLPKMALGDPALCRSAKAEKKQTKPPAPYTEKTLLDDMEAVHKFVDDPKLKATLKSVKGIGTPSTRASIIENIVRRGFIRREGKKLLPSPLAITMIAVVPKTVSDPATTALWEQVLDEIEAGRESLDNFMLRQQVWVKQIVEGVRGTSISVPGYQGKNSGGSAPARAQGAGHQSVGSCPKCKSPLFVRVARKGPNAGNSFKGCSGYPNCSYTESMTPGETPAAKKTFSAPRPRGSRSPGASTRRAYGR